MNEEFAEYEDEKRARDRAMDVYERLYNSEMNYDDMEAYCIAVLDSEFMDYPDGALEAQLMDILYKLRNG